MSVIEAASHTSRVLVDGTLVLQVHIEPRFRDQAMALFGAPGTAMALAGLKATRAAEVSDFGASVDDKPPKRERMGPLCEWAVYRCKEPQFWQWIRPVYDKAMGGDGSGWGDVGPDDFKGGTPDYAAHAIKVLCNVESRKELDTNGKAAGLFQMLIRRPYADWLKANP